jgi:hypothetical protein
MLVGVSIGRVNREMVFRLFFVILPNKREEKRFQLLRIEGPGIKEKLQINPKRWCRRAGVRTLICCSSGF